MENRENVQLFVLGEVGRQYFFKKDVDVDTNFRFTVLKFRSMPESTLRL